MHKHSNFELQTCVMIRLLKICHNRVSISFLDALLPVEASRIHVLACNYVFLKCSILFVMYVQQIKCHVLVNYG